MKVIFGLVIIGIVLSLGGCKKNVKYNSTQINYPYGNMQNAEYPINECNERLSQSMELLHKDRQIDSIIIYKSRRLLEVYNKGNVITTSRISLGKNADLGDKIQVGDYKTPIGAYTIVRKKCDSRLYKSLLLSYPNDKDRERSRKLGIQPGGLITIHGQPKWNTSGIGDNYTLTKDWTEGCIAVSNKMMDFLWVAVANGTPIRLYK